MSDLQSQNYIRISATTITPPSVRRHEQEVAKLIDVTRCIGCKACQAACMEWNDLRGEVGHFEGTYDNPLDLDPNTWTLMRFTEWDNDQGNLEWLIRKDGCMHCEDPGCLKACPAPGAIVQYANGIVDFISENCIGCGYCIKGCPFNIPRVSKIDHKSYKCTLCSDRVTVGKEPACVKACPTGAIMFGSKTDMTAWAGERVIDLKSRGFENAGLYDPPRRRRHPCDVCASPRRSAVALRRTARQSEDQRAGRDLEGRFEAAGGGRRRARRRCRIFSLDNRWAERSAARGRHRGGEAHSGIGPQSHE